MSASYNTNWVPNNKIATFSFFFFYRKVKTRSMYFFSDYNYLAEHPHHPLIRPVVTFCPVCLQWRYTVARITLLPSEESMVHCISATSISGCTRSTLSSVKCISGLRRSSNRSSPLTPTTPPPCTSRTHSSSSTR